MDAIDLSKKNPFQSYHSNFGANFSFGKEFDDWVTQTMLAGVLTTHDLEVGLVSLADIGAGSCYWARLFLRAKKSLQITAVDPSSDLIVDQADRDLDAELDSVRSRLRRKCMSAQHFANECGSSSLVGSFDCIYFMQSAHYVGQAEFEEVFSNLAKGLKPNQGRIVIQARNMSEAWYPWAFPYEWKERVEGALHATSMFGRADLYMEKFRQMPSVFSSVSVFERPFDVCVKAEDYWDRLENRWIPTFMNEEIIPADLHRSGIDAMKRRFEQKQEKYVRWLEKYALVVASV